MDFSQQLANPLVQKQIAERTLIELHDPDDIVWLQWPSLRCHTDEEHELFEGRVKLDRFQKDMLRSAFDPAYRIMAVKGCTKAGKGLSAALIANLTYDLFPNGRVVLSGPKFDAVKKTVYSEIANWRKAMRYPYPAYVGNESVTDDSGNKDMKHAISINVPNSPEGFSGVHSERTVYIIDEATDTPPWYVQNAIQQAALIICLANPRTLSGWFRALFDPAEPDVTKDRVTEYGLARCITVSAEDLINVRHKRLMTPAAPRGGMEIDGHVYEEGERIQKEHIPKTRLLIPAQKDYSDYCLQRNHRDDMIRLVFCLGQFPKEDQELQIIPTSWLPRHTAYWNSLNRGHDIEVEAVGVDIATSADGDDSAVALGGYMGCRTIESRPGAPAEDTAPWTVAMLEKHGVDVTAGKIPVAVDSSGGYGEATGLLLREWGVWVVPVNSGAGPSFDKERYKDARAELWGELAKRLDPNGDWPDPELMLVKQKELGTETHVDWKQVEDQPWGIPDNFQDLIDGITAQQRRGGTDRKLQLIPKRPPPKHRGYAGDTVVGRMKDRRSPDKADALALLWRALMELEYQKTKPKRYTSVDRPLLILTEADIVQASKPKDPVAAVLASLDERDKREDWFAGRSFS